MSDLSVVKQLVLQFFAADLGDKNGSVIGVGVGTGVVNVYLRRPITQQLESVNGVPIEYHLGAPAQEYIMPIDPDRLIYDDQGNVTGYRTE